MISFVKGELSEITDNSIIVECNGIGYGINFPSGCISLLPPVGSQVKIFTYMAVREDDISLYGFTSSDDLYLFRQLIKVNGVGAKVGMSIIGAMPAEDIRFAILSGDHKAFSKVSGVGPKTAQKIVLELKDKIEINSVSDGAVIKNNSINATIEDAVLALEELGFSKSDAIKAINNIENAKSYDSGKLVKMALAYLL